MLIDVEMMMWGNREHGAEGWYTNINFLLRVNSCLLSMESSHRFSRHLGNHKSGWLMDE